MWVTYVYFYYINALQIHRTYTLEMNFYMVFMLYDEDSDIRFFFHFSM